MVYYVGGKASHHRSLLQICLTNSMAVFVYDERDKYHMQTTLMYVIALINLATQGSQFQKDYNLRALSFIPRELAE